MLMQSAFRPGAGRERSHEKPKEVQDTQCPMSLEKNAPKRYSRDCLQAELN